MDELCVMLAEKLGLAIDVSGEFLKSAVPQYATMEFVRHTFFAVAAVVFAVVFFLVASRNFKKMLTDDCYDSDFYCITSMISFLSAVLLIAAFVYEAPTAICWFVSPDAMLLKTLVSSVVS